MECHLLSFGGKAFSDSLASGRTDEPVAEIVPNTQPPEIAFVFNDFPRRVISL
jgi:hypothetical protein